MSLAKFFLIKVIALITLAGLGAQAPNWMWVKQAGSTGIDICAGIATDNAGNSYVCGWFAGTATFGTTSLTSDNASQDIFVGKLDAAGNWLWAQRAGGSTNDYGRGIAIDPEGNIYLTGSFTGTASFGPHALANSGYPDIFVAKLTTLGNWLWASGAGGTAEDEAWAIAVDNGGNSFITGSIRAVANFGPIQIETNNFSFDLFAAKLDDAGNWLWAVKGGGNDFDCGYGIALDNAGHAYVTGYFEGSASFGALSLNGFGTQPDIFVGQLTDPGVWLWAEHGGGTGYDNGIAIAADSAGNIYVTGFYYSSATFGALTLSASPDIHIFTAKLNNEGNWLWAKQPDGNATGSGNGIALDSGGGVYLAGNFSGAAGFGPVSLTSSGGNDVFAAKLDASGNWLWGQKAGGVQDDGGVAVGVDGAGHSYVTGYLNGYVNFGSIVIDGYGFTDAFIAKLSPGGVPVVDNVVPALQDGLLTVSPNPFRTRTSIRVRLDGAGADETGAPARISIYDLRGRLVRSLGDEDVTAGNILVSWDGRDMSGRPCAGGVYIARLSLRDGRELAARISLVD